VDYQYAFTSSSLMGATQYLMHGSELRQQVEFKERGILFMIAGAALMVLTNHATT
jgi:hypothetical protein